ncbi:MAG: zinc-binding dehydrogenase [Bdellovibrio sp. ArHS]|uniref:quinone oxidoreductase family protein n=1 Tax=Bdellovibrio sp. ArHS TaxID=1569284 RepID=UPI000582C6AA|nr:NADP-dependent oxidoreductase [Bdellovibrio sp. ArHS]KHD90079.1 MAG: zinc-binding dehydrogenase [Bdellovibrio sp. ArHS]
MNSPQSMHTISINHFGGPEELRLQDLPIPRLANDEILIQIAYAGVGPWDPKELHGEFEQYKSEESHFPYILGSEGAGTVAAIGSEVKRFKVGDKVYASGFLNPKGGFYAEYAAINESLAFPLPKNLSFEQAAVMAGVGVTALRGLQDILNIQPGQSILIFGASGGIGHVAVQLAKQMKAKVLAVASGQDGVELAKNLGADESLDGHAENLVDRIKEKAPQGVDAILFTAGGKDVNKLFVCLKPDGIAAAPNGVDIPMASVPLVKTYDGDPDEDILHRFHRMIDTGRFTIHVAKIFPLEKAAEAHQALSEHHLGKLALKIH